MRPLLATFPILELLDSTDVHWRGGLLITGHNPPVNLSNTYIKP